MTDWIAAIKARHSVRRYSKALLTEDVVTSLRQAITQAEPLDASVATHISLMPFADIGSRSTVGATAIYNAAPWYLVAHAPPGPGRMEEIGFRMEQVILSATSLGLGTCWIGGMFRSGVLASHLGCQAHDIIAISPVGWPEGGYRQKVAYVVVESIAARRGKRKPLTDFVFCQSWEEPLNQASVTGDVLEALQMARVAPSWSNVQPWYFLISENVVWAIADSRPQRGNTRAGKPYYCLDVGIAMSHFWLAMQQRGHTERWQSLRNSDDEVQKAPGLPEYAVRIGRYTL